MIAVYREHEHQLDQGDLLVDAPFLDRRGDEHDEASQLGLVTSHGCDCERYERQLTKGADDGFVDGYCVQVAPVLAAADFERGLLGDIRRGRVTQYFSIPDESPWDELVVDLHQEQPIPVVRLLDCIRQASLSAEMWHRLVVHIFRLQSHIKPETVFAPEFLREA